MSSPQPNEQPRIPQIVSGSEIAVTVHAAQVHVYTITEEQLDNLALTSRTFNVGCASALFGTLVSLVIYWLSGGAPDSPTLTGVVAGATVAIGILMVVFVLLAVQDFKRNKDVLRRFKEQARNPSGIAN
jgi:hypothetical protein